MGIIRAVDSPIDVDAVSDRAAAYRERMADVNWYAVAANLLLAPAWLIGYLVALVLTGATLLLGAFVEGYHQYRDAHPIREPAEGPDLDENVIFRGSGEEAPPSMYAREA